MSGYVGEFEVSGLPFGRITVPYSPDSALDARLGQLSRRGQYGERCRACLDCTNNCGVLNRPVRRGWKITYRRPTHRSTT